MIIGIISYGEMTKPLGSGFLEPPREQWVAGTSLEKNTAFTYKLSHIDNDYRELQITFGFIEKQDNNWRVSLAVDDPQSGKIEEELLMSEIMIPSGSTQGEIRPYLKTIQNSILWIVNYAAEPKYLALGAVWGSITIGVQKQDLKVTEKEDVITEAGTFESYVLSYNIKDKENKVWIARDKPLPVKSEIYDPDGKLQFRFELVSIN